MIPNRLVVAGTGTDVGKTVVSAILCGQFEADYWKPVSSGSEDGPVDDQMMSRLIAGGSSRIHSSTYTFRKSLSPHIAAHLDGQRVEIDQLKVPNTERPLIIELAGGVAVPLNDTQTNLELMAHWMLPVVVVSRHYLGSINHTLLTLEALRSREIPIAGVVFNGEELPDTERIIQDMAKVTVWGRVPYLTEVTPEALRKIKLHTT